MESIGDGNGHLPDEDLPWARPALLTSEGRCLTAAGLVLCSLFIGGLFQFLGFIVLDRSGGGSQAMQYTVYAAPSGLTAAAGAWLARQSLGTPDLDRILRGLAGAAFVIGVVIAVATAVGIATAFTLAPDF